MQVEEIVADDTVKTLDESVLHELAGLDEMEGGTGTLNPMESFLDSKEVEIKAGGTVIPRK